jgi:hypothetical protein
VSGVQIPPGEQLLEIIQFFINNVTTIVLSLKDASLYQTGSTPGILRQEAHVRIMLVVQGESNVRIPKK